MIRVGISMISVLAVSSAVAVPVAWGASLGSQDLRTPDARDAVSAPVPSGAVARSVDLRSPDARDAAAGRPAGGSTVVDVIRIPAPAAGFDWGDAAIGAGAAGGLVLVGFGSTRAVSRRRRHVSRPALG